MMRTCVLDYWKGREELGTMDDELPVIIYIFVMTSLANLPSEIMQLLDYVRRTDYFENE